MSETTLPIKVKWLKNKYDVIVMLDESVEVLKAQLFDLTGVPPDKQKITSGAKQIKDDTDLKTIGLKANQLLLLVGSAETLAAPSEKVVFVEDLAPEEMQGIIAAGIPMGLTNLENTCYMNASLQIINNAPDLTEALKKLQGAPTIEDPRKSLAVATREVIRELDKAHEPVQPVRFLYALRTAFPQFAETGEQGRAMQQDAEECFTQLMAVLSEQLQEGGQSVVKRLFGIETEVTVKTERENLLKITCHIEGGPDICLPEELNKWVSSDGKGGTDMLPQAISKGLESSVEKNSPSLGRTAVYTKSAKISKLPKYLVTQVKFPVILDMKEYCTADYQTKISAWREKVLEQQAAEKEAKKAKKPGASDAGAAAQSSTTAGGDAAAVAVKEPEATGPGAAEADKGGMEVEAAVKAEGPRMDDETVWASYELTGVLTHQGRTAEGGHYMAWIKKNSQWYKFDDDKVSEVKEDEIKKLYGGGDWHMAYICLYQRCPVVMGTDSTRY